MTAPARPIGDELRGRIRRTLDHAVVIAAPFGIANQAIWFVVDPSLAAGIATVVAVVLCTIGLLGVLGRAPWTPYAYVAVLAVGNFLYLPLFGPWFGMGAVYLLAIAIALVYMPRRWWWPVGITFAIAPVLVGLALAAGLFERSPALDLASGSEWRRAALAAGTCVVGIAVIVGSAVRQLIHARHDLERALRAEREQAAEQARLDEELARARRAELIAQLAAEVGADVGAALAIVQARAQALAAELRGPEAMECLADVAEAATNAGTTMRSLTAFAPAPATAEDCGDAADAARAVSKLVRRSIPSRIALAIVAADHAPVAIATTDLARICSNLVLNARDAIAGEGTITVTVTCGTTHVTIEVRDDGSGMDDDTLARLYQPFFTTKPVGRGTGLGLATTKILVERAHGSIEVASAIGRGSRFTIRLPLVPLPATAQVSSLASSESTASPSAASSSSADATR